jgi:hypothetical protein
LKFGVEMSIGRGGNDFKRGIEIRMGDDLKTGLR